MGIIDYVFKCVALHGILGLRSAVKIQRLDVSAKVSKEEYEEKQEVANPTM